MDDTYTADGQLQPTRKLDMEWIDGVVIRWCNKWGINWLPYECQLTRLIRRSTCIPIRMLQARVCLPNSKSVSPSSRIISFLLAAKTFLTFM